MAISSSSFQFLQKLLSSRSGISVAERDKYLVEARLLALSRQQRLVSVEDLIKKVQSESPNGLEHMVLDALLPKETSFFRDMHPFDLLKSQIFRALEGSRFRECTIRIWCAGCSSGQEAFSIAMILHRYFSHLLQWKIEIIATDLSPDALAKARKAKYDEVEVNRGVQPVLIREYFRQDGLHFVIKEELSKLVRFEELNLVGDWPEQPPVDIIFLRNVLRYMGATVKAQILAKVKKVLRPDGFLFLGAQESTVGADDSFQMVPTEKTVYFQTGNVPSGL